MKQIASHFGFYKTIEKNLLFIIGDDCKLIETRFFDRSKEIHSVEFYSGVLFPSIPLFMIGIQDDYDYAIVENSEGIYLHYNNLGKNEQVQIGEKLRKNDYSIGGNNWQIIKENNYRLEDSCYGVILPLDSKINIEQIRESFSGKVYCLITSELDKTTVANLKLFDGILFTKRHQILKIWKSMAEAGISMEKILQYSVLPILELLENIHKKEIPFHLSIVENVDFGNLQITNNSTIREIRL